jgi:hypothetical protein
MALLRIKPKEFFSTNRYLENAFFKFYPHLRRVPLSRFYNADAAALVLGIPPKKMKDTLISSKTLTGYEIIDPVYYTVRILVHPDGVIERAHKRSRKMLKELHTPEV